MKPLRKFKSIPVPHQQEQQEWSMTKQSARHDLVCNLDLGRIGLRANGASAHCHNRMAARTLGLFHTHTLAAHLSPLFVASFADQAHTVSRHAGA